MKSTLHILITLFLACTIVFGDQKVEPPKIAQGEEYRIQIKGVPGEDQMRWYVQPYRVEANGDINLPDIGKLRVAGMTREEAEKFIEHSLKDKGLFTRPQIKITPSKKAEHE